MSDIIVVEQQRGRYEKPIETEIDLSEIKYLQVCMVGAKLGADKDRVLGTIFPIDELKAGDVPFSDPMLRSTLKDRIQAGTLKPRTENDYNTQQEHGLDSIPWKSAFGSDVTPSVIAASVTMPEAVKSALGIEEPPPPPPPPPPPSPSASDFEEMTKAEVQMYCDDNGIEYGKRDSKKTLLSKIEDSQNN